MLPQLSIRSLHTVRPARPVLAVSLLALPGVAFSQGLPTMENSSRGTGSGIIQTIQNYGYDHSCAARPAFRQRAQVVGSPAGIRLRLHPLHFSAVEPLAHQWRTRPRAKAQISSFTARPSEAITMRCRRHPCIVAKKLRPVGRNSSLCPQPACVVGLFNTSLPGVAATGLRVPPQHERAA